MSVSANGSAHKVAHVVVERLFVGPELQAHGVSPAGRELYAHLAPGVAHHDVGQQLAQPAAVLGQARVALDDELAAKLARRLELARA